MMKRLFLLTVACGAMLASALPAKATHNSWDPDQFFEYWDMTTGQGSTVKWRWTASVGAAGRGAIWKAMDDWNTVAAPLRWKRESPDYANFDPEDCGALAWRQNAVHVVNDPSLAPGWVVVCAGTYINKANMVINDAYNWHVDAYTSPAWYQLDLRSTATHEWGHMNGQVKGGSGQGHWWESSNDHLCADAGTLHHPLRESLCPNAEYGQTVQRVPAYHEITLLQEAY